MTATVPPIGAHDELALRDLLEVLRRRAGLVALAVLLGGLATGLFAAWRAPRYEAEAALLFQEESGSNELLSSLAALPVDLGSLGGASARVAGEIEALRSRAVLRAALLGAPERPHVAWLDDLDRQSAWRKLAERLGRGAPPEGSLAVEVRSWPFGLEEVEGLRLTFPRPGVVRAEREGLLADEQTEAPFRAGEPVRLCGAELVLAPTGELLGRRFRLRVAGFERAALELGEALAVQENPAGSGVVRVRLADVDGRRAAERVNALLAAYEAECRTRRQRVTGRPIELLEAERVRVLGGLEAAEQRLRQFGERAGPIALPGAASAALDKLAEVDLQRAKLELEAKVSTDLLARLRAGTLAREELSGLEVGGIFTHELVEPLLALLAEKDELARQFTDEWPGVVLAEGRVQQRVAALTDVLEAQRWTRERAEADLETLVAQYAGELAGLPSIQVELARLRREVEAHSQVYLFLVGRIEQARIAEAAVVPPSYVLEAAVAPLEAETPGLPLLLALGLALGGLAGVGLALLGEYHQRPVASARQVELLLGLPAVELVRGVAGGGARAERRRAAYHTARALLLGTGTGGARRWLVVGVGARERVEAALVELALVTAQVALPTRLVALGAGAAALEKRCAARRERPAAGAFRFEAWSEAPRAAELAQRLAGEELVLVVPASAAAEATALELATACEGVVLLCARAREEELARVVRRLAHCGVRPAAVWLARG